MSKKIKNQVEIIEPVIGEGGVAEEETEQEYLDETAGCLENILQGINDSEFSDEIADEIQKATNKLEGAILCLRQAAEKLNG